MSQFTSPSPPPLRHPVPTHPAYIPEPPSTPASPQGYQRFTSSPAPPGPLQQHQAMGPGPGLAPQGQHQQQQYDHAGFSGPQGRQYAQHPQGGGGASHLQAYPTHVPAYGVPSPFAHSQAQQQQGVPPPYLHGQMQGSMHPQDRHGQHGGPGFEPPNFAAWGLDGTTAQLGMQLGSSAVAAGQDYMQRNFGTILPSTYIKHHFNVSNSYVITKLRLVLFPWRQKSWARRSRISSGPAGGQGGQGQNQAVQEWMAPREDVNCPDLYIPVMAIVTYVLLTALHAGVHSTFDPRILGDSASRATTVVLLDFAFVKLGCYILNITGSSQVVDLVAYGGYKFVGVILAVVATFLGVSGALWWFVFVYAFLANAFFLLRSLRTLILPDASTAPPTHATSTVTHAQRRRRIVFLLLEAVLQAGYMGWLVRV